MSNVRGFTADDCLLWSRNFAWAALFWRAWGFDAVARECTRYADAHRAAWERGL